MTVVLNEAVLARLLETQDGPVGRHVEGKAQEVVQAAQQNLRTYFAGAPTVGVDRDVGYLMDGSSALVGIVESGGKAARMAQAQQEGKVNWLLNALRSVFGGG